MRDRFRVFFNQRRRGVCKKRDRKSQVVDKRKESERHKQRRKEKTRNRKGRREETRSVEVECSESKDRYRREFEKSELRKLDEKDKYGKWIRRKVKKEEVREGWN